MDLESRRKRKREASRTSDTPLCDDVLVDVLLRLPSLATLARAALVCTQWRRVATSRDFLRRFRALHHSPLLLGCFVSFAASAGAVFHRAQICSNRDLVAAVRGGDFLLTGMEDDLRWRLRDCRQGVLLLASRDQFALFNPVSRRRLNLSRPPICRAYGNYIFSFHSCLLPSCGGGEGDGHDARPVSFRVVLLESGDLVRAHMYSSDTGERNSHPWASASIKAPSPRWNQQDPSEFPSMHAAGRIYWKYEEGNVLLSLDTRSMEFSHVALPPVPDLRWPTAPYVVGDTEDGDCCLVCVGNVPAAVGHILALQVWLRDEEAGSWELETQVHDFLRLMTEEGGLPLSNVRQICAVTTGVVLLRTDGGCGRYRHVAFRLKSLIAGTRRQHNLQVASQSRLLLQWAGIPIHHGMAILLYVASAPKQACRRWGR